MANVGIIVYAAQKTGEEELLEVAAKHCLTTQK